MEIINTRESFQSGKRCKYNTKNDNQQIDCRLIVPVAGTLLETKKIGQSRGIRCDTEAI